MRIVNEKRDEKQHLANLGGRSLHGPKYDLKV